MPTDARGLKAPEITHDLGFKLGEVAKQVEEQSVKVYSTSLLYMSFAFSPS